MLFRLFGAVALLGATLGWADAATAQGTRATFGLQVLYGWEEAAGDTVPDLAGVGTPLDLVIADTTAVSWLPAGGLALLDPVVITGSEPANRVSLAVAAAGELSLEVWLAPADTVQAGPAGILALAAADTSGQDNVRLGQSGRDLIFRPRTTGSDSLGWAGLTVPGALDGGLQHVVCTLDSLGIARVYLDGVLAGADSLAGAVSAWAPTCMLAAGGTAVAGAAWRGEMHLAAVYARALGPAEIAGNFGAGPRLSALGPLLRHVAVAGSDTTGDGSLQNPYGTIQRAIDLSSGGDTVELADGTYSGPGNRVIDLQGKDLLVVSGSGDRSACIVDADGQVGFRLHAGETAACILRGLTITDADVGILIGDPTLDSGARPTVDDCVIELCTIGIEVRDTSSAPLIFNCLLSGNGVGLSYLEDAPGGRVEATRITGSTSHGLLTSGTWTVYGGTEFTVEGCEIDNNAGTGVRHLATFGKIALVDAQVHDNGDWGVYSNAYNDYGVAIAGGAVHTNAAGGINTTGSQWDGISNCKIYGNQGPGLLTGFDSIFNVTDCIIHDNTGDGIRFGNEVAIVHELPDKWNATTVTGCEIHHNGGDGIDFGPNSIHHDNLVADCTIWSNTGAGLRITTPFNASAQTRVLVSTSTITDNAVGIDLVSDTPLVMDHTLVAFNLGAGLACGPGAVATVDCSDFYGNPGGDEPACLPGLIGTAGNISADPRFCDAAGGVFTLDASSPCLAANNPGCGGIGAAGEGCTQAPVITGITDVGNDQGRQVRLAWQRSIHDQPGGDHVITGYGVYRRQDGNKTPGPRAGSDAKILGWDYLVTVPARQDEFYQVVAPTLCDSTISAGLCTTTFMVSAMTASPGVYFDSAPDSGYSVDNLSPAAPANLTVAYGAGQNVLSWERPADGDFAHVLVYRVPCGTGDPVGTTDPVQVTSADSWSDDLAGVANAWENEYWLVAVDFAGNPSPAVGHVAVTAADDPARPRRTSLLPAAPNPFNPRTVISFDLATPAAAELVIYDVSGRMVRRLLTGDRIPPGRHAVPWSGQDDQGRRVAAGVYVYRLVAGEFVQSHRMTLLK